MFSLFCTPRSKFSFHITRNGLSKKFYHIQTKYVEKYDSANTAATTNKASHEANLDSINTEIANLQAESDRLAIDVKTAYENMNYYQSMANSASSE